MNIQIATIIGISGDCIKVRSLKSEEKCRADGYQYEWLINKYSLTHDEYAAERLGISQIELDAIISKLTP